MPTARDQLAVASLIRDALMALEWTPGGALIFSPHSVRISPLLDFAVTQMPAARIVLGSERADEFEPAIRTVQIDVVVANTDYRDADLQATVAGVVVDASGNTSQARGIEAIARRIELAIQILGRDTVPIVFRAMSRGGWQNEQGTVITRTMTFEAICAVEDEA